MPPQQAFFSAQFPGQVESVIGYWLDRDSWGFERWDILPGTLLVNRQQKTIRFDVKAQGTDPDEPFQVVVRQTAKGWVLKADCSEDPTVEYALQVFESQDAILLVYSGKVNQVYIHIETAG